MPLKVRGGDREVGETRDGHAGGAGLVYLSRPLSQTQLVGRRLANAVDSVASEKVVRISVVSGAQKRRPIAELKPIRSQKGQACEGRRLCGGWPS